MRRNGMSHTFVEADTMACVVEINRALVEDHRASSSPAPELALPPVHPSPTADPTLPGIPQLDFSALHTSSIRPRRLGDALWRARVREILHDSPALEQQSLRNARIPGSARFLEWQLLSP